MRSKDERWAQAIGNLAEGLRGDCPFTYGDTIGFGGRISRKSSMTAFAVFAPAALDSEDCRIDVSVPGHEGHDIIHLKGMYPIYESERQYIRKHGLEAFWQLEWDPTTSPGTRQSKQWPMWAVRILRWPLQILAWP